MLFGSTILALTSFLGNSLCAQENAPQGTCVDPVISSTSGPGSICDGESATLTATHDGEGVNWFDAEVGGTMVGSGSPFDTGPLTTTTSFWAEAYNVGTGVPITGGARVTYGVNQHTSVNSVTSPWGLAFNADVDMTINSVDVFIADASPGTLNIQLKDSGLTILEDEFIATPAGNSSNPVQFTVDLNWFVPAGTDYNIVAESSPDIVRELAIGGFPYPIGTAGTVTNGTINDNDTNATTYYFFYNWTVTPGQNCYSDRVEEVVTVNPIPAAPTGASNQDFSPGDTLADLDVTGSNLTWYSDAGGTNAIPDTTPLVDGTTYYVSQTVDGCESSLLAITVTEVLGVAENQFSNLVLAPIPVKSVLQIENKQPIAIIEVFSILGQRLLLFHPDQHNVEVDLSSLAEGQYLIRLTSEGQSITKKISKL